MVEYKNRYSEFTEQNATILAISVDSLEVAKKFKTEEGLPFPLLCDLERSVIRAWRLNNKVEGNIPFPNVYVIDENMEIVFHSADKTASRVNSEPLLDFLRTHAESPETRTKNSKVKTMWPSLMDVIFYLPRRFRK